MCACLLVQKHVSVCALNICTYHTLGMLATCLFTNDTRPMFAQRVRQCAELQRSVVVLQSVTHIILTMRRVNTYAQIGLGIIQLGKQLFVFVCECFFLSGFEQYCRLSILCSLCQSCRARPIIGNYAIDVAEGRQPARPAPNALAYHFINSTLNALRPSTRSEICIRHNIHGASEHSAAPARDPNFGHVRRRTPPPPPQKEVSRKI